VEIPAPGVPETGPEGGAPTAEPFGTEAAVAAEPHAALEPASAGVAAEPPVTGGASPPAEESVPIVTQKLHFQPFDEAPAEAPPVGPGPEVQGVAEQAPTVLKAVLGAPSKPISSKVASAPPATLALARLYVQQQALGEATRVLERLLEREPTNVEAQDLLSLVRDMMEPLPAAPPPLSRRERKIAALQHWLACLTLGRERATR
jgi:hypothetical protein